MTTVFATLSILLAIASAAYLQFPTFLLSLGYRWFHNYKLKRWVFRFFAALSFLLFLFYHPGVWTLAGVGIPFSFLWIFSLVNANPKVYIALKEKDIIKSNENSYSEDTEILGYVDKNNNAICYPLNELVKPRHLLNDTFLGVPLFVSYCMACRSAMVYDPLAEGVRLHFEVLGVYRRNMVMRDTETASIWQQGTGEAVYGKLTGKQLKYLPYQIMPIGEWLLLHPGSFIAKESRLVRDGIFSKDRLMRMMKITETLVAPGRTDLTGLPPREKIFGIELNGKNKAYPVSELQRGDSRFADNIGGVEIIIRYNKTSNFFEAIEKISGRQIPVQSHWWFGWKEFHPGTEIWKSK